MNAVAIGVSKGKSMVAILPPYGEIISKLSEVRHSSSDIQSLIDHITIMNCQVDSTRNTNWNIKQP